jgi:hypothetical protein
MQNISITRLRDQKDKVGGRDWVMYYFEVVNKSEALTIEWVHAQLEEMIPEVKNLDWLPVPLQQKHDNSLLGNARKTDFNLNPSEHKHIDLVSAFYGDDHFTVHHIVGAGVNQTVPLAGRHRLRIRTTAKDMPALDKWFVVWMNDDGVLQCEME